MSSLSDLAPTKRERIVDLVRAAGIDVSDWANFKGGRKKAASNPRYCYEWSFVEANKVVVLNLWFANLHQRNGVVVCDFNMRETAERAGQIPNNTVRQNRCRKMDEAVQRALKENLTVRVVICEGERHHIDDEKASRVSKRRLDKEPWAITAYDSSSGQCTLTRGSHSGRFVDQFAVQEETSPQAERHTISGEVFLRNREIRRQVLFRANGLCEWCSQPGFSMADGRVFLETHHVVPLGEGGPDTLRNVVALCPNHHREAHYGVISGEMRRMLLGRLAKP